MHIKILGKEIEVEYAKVGSYHQYHANFLGVHVTDLNKQKAYARFTKDLAKVVANPNG